MSVTAATLALVLVSLPAGCDKPMPAGGVDRTKMVTELEKERSFLVDLGNTLRDSADQLAKKNQYPDELMAQLESIEVPAPNWSGHDISKLPPVVVDSLLRYGGDLRVLAKRKDQLKNLLRVAKPRVEKYLSERDNPTVSFSVWIDKTPSGPQAFLVKHKEPFIAAAPWPESYSVLRLQDGKPVEQQATRYLRGAPEGTVVPIEPETITGLTDRTMVDKLRKALWEAATSINGSGTPAGQADPGLVEANKQLAKTIRDLVVVRE